MRLFLVFLIIAGVFAAPVALDDIEDDFNESPAIEAHAEGEKPDETPETAPEPEKEPEDSAVPETEEDAVPAESDAPVPVIEETNEAEAPVENPEDTETEPADPVEENPSEDAASDTEGNTEGDDDDDDEDSDLANDGEAAAADEEPVPAEEEPVVGEETEPAVDEEPVPAEEEPVAEDGGELPAQAEKTESGAEVTVKGVTVRFALSSRFQDQEDTELRHYTVKITNGSDQKLCGVTFNAGEVSHLYRLAKNDDGSLTTTGLNLVPGGIARHFNFDCVDRPLPIVTDIKFC